MPGTVLMLLCILPYLLITGGNTCLLQWGYSPHFKTNANRFSKVKRLVQGNALINNGTQISTEIYLSLRVMF